MNIHEAKQIIRNDSASQTEWFLAGAEISQSSESSWEDLLICLKRGGTIASGAATTLYVRTKRPQSDIPSGFSMSYQDWFDYLQRQGMIQ